MKKSKKIRITYKYIGDKGSETDRLEAERKLEKVYDMLFEKISKKLMKSPKEK